MMLRGRGAIGLWWLTLTATSAAAAPALGPLGPAVLGTAAQGFAGFTLENANPPGPLLWAAWGQPAATQTVRLALLAKSATGEIPLWSTAWPGAYQPALRLVPEWSFAGHPLIALTMQFGAAATQIDLFGLDAGNHPIQLAEQTAAAIEWSIDSAGNPVLVLYNMPDSALIPSCFAWSPNRRALQPTGCKRSD